ncbi:PepSY domain-containing protein [Streptomyces sp. Je 1-4]|uniref:PepSY domain-containing protein n=1 Tax=Streptomyces TaxID=1883 RepID=UPI002180D6C6|nr:MULTISPECIES: PepSY domain-containing protein [unclassified Streptomyces]UYB39394.1 PepSY domain-containing protein [Streptomyces sp. Je 1-4]UZQ35424.1 PepSY domain-containing protein [Streptomyces sp. Je 1-4] [Streptomyces sp. Je 1-4 4N24]UZQ42842.1 PepSY domain-containing protein [Streptomyces sp. Je 1-4] [Streptomyces sp. Je 1-4 4N24_ara]
MDTNRSGVVVRRGRPAGPRTIGLVCAVAAAGALLSGCGNSGNDTGSPQKSGAPSGAVPATAPASPTGSLNADQARRKALVPKAKVDYGQALKAAIAAVPSSEAIAAELKGTPASPYWDTVVATTDGAAYAVRVDAVSGKAEQPRPQSDDPEDKQELAARLTKATVTAQQAAQTATEKTKGTVTTIELGDADHGNNNDTVAWTVGVVTTDDWYETTYEIDATNRKVLWMNIDQD